MGAINATRIMPKPLSLRFGMVEILTLEGTGSPQWAQFCHPEAIGFPQLVHLALSWVPHFGQEEYSSRTGALQLGHS